MKHIRTFLQGSLQANNQISNLENRSHHFCNQWELLPKKWKFVDKVGFSQRRLVWGLILRPQVEKMSQEILELLPALLHRFGVPLPEVLLRREVEVAGERELAAHFVPKFVHLRVPLKYCPFRVSEANVDLLDTNLHVDKSTISKITPYTFELCYMNLGGALKRIPSKHLLITMQCNDGNW